MNQFTDFKQEISSGQRFEFGKNWQRFLIGLNEERIKGAEESLKQMLQMENLLGKRFLDVGSGSGLFSLVAKRLGAIVHSFDYDPQSTACTAELKKRYYPDDNQWTVEEGSILNADYIKSLGTFDIVYSWGVLHHTGAMWQALENVQLLVPPGGKLFIAIYNDQGDISRYWLMVKRIYNLSPKPIKGLAVLIVASLFAVRKIFKKVLFCKIKCQSINTTMNPNNRGMSRWHDLVDWVGGYPFEVAKPEEIFEFFIQKGFQLTKLKTCAGGLGCNQYVFLKIQ